MFAYMTQIDQMCRTELWLLRHWQMVALMTSFKNNTNN